MSAVRADKANRRSDNLCRRKFYEAVSAGRRKAQKLLDINSEEWLKDPELPDQSE